MGEDRPARNLPRPSFFAFVRYPPSIFRLYRVGRDKARTLMTAKRILLIVSTVGSFLVFAAVTARPQALDPSFSPTNQTSCPDEIVVGEGTRTSRICPEYEKKRTCAGEQDVPLKITITGLASLKLLGVSLAEQALTEQPLGAQPVSITFSQSNKPTTRAAAVPPMIEYSYKMSISREARARKYQVRLKLQYPNENPFVEDFTVKVCSGGGIRLSDDSPKVITAFTGRDAAFRLKLSNAFEHYPVNIREIRIRTKPADLIEPREQTLSYPTPESIKHQEDKPFDISFTLAGMSAEQLFFGFDADSRIMLDFIYDDGEDRGLVDLREIKLEVRPNVVVLLVSILAGVLSGLLIRTYLQHVERTQQISRREQVIFIFGTAAVGIVLSLVALFAKVQVVAFKLEGSSDDPRVLFIISLAVTIIGSPLIYSLFKPPKSGESRPKALGSALGTGGQSDG